MENEYLKKLNALAKESREESNCYDELHTYSLRELLKLVKWLEAHFIT